MKHTIRMIGLLVFGILATSCNKPTDDHSKAQSDQAKTAAEQREKAITATKEAAQSVQDYAYAKKSEFIDAANQELSDIQAEMERLRVEVDHSTGAARDDAEAKLKVVNEKWVAAKAQLDTAETATEATWNDVQNRYRTARGDLKSSFDEARQWLSERIEP